MGHTAQQRFGTYCTLGRPGYQHQVVTEPRENRAAEQVTVQPVALGPHRGGCVRPSCSSCSCRDGSSAVGAGTEFPPGTLSLAQAPGTVSGRAVNQQKGEHAGLSASAPQRPAAQPGSKRAGSALPVTTRQVLRELLQASSHPTTERRDTATSIKTSLTCRIFMEFLLKAKLPKYSKNSVSSDSARK